MRELTVKWESECKKCGALLEVGVVAMYEKSMGLFCLGHEPKEVEDIRAFRLALVERKATRYEEWAEKRKVKATATLNSNPSMRHDWAFITQPGHIPARAQMNKADERAYKSLDVAEGMKAKAERLRNVRVAGDAERRREEVRAALDTVIGKGSRVYDYIFGPGEVIGVYSKSYRIKFDKGCTYSRDKSYIKPLDPFSDAAKSKKIKGE